MADEQTRTLDDDAREARIGRILDDFLTRRARGEKISEAELLAEHADLADDLREHLELLGELRPPADKIEALITQGLLARDAGTRYPAKLGAYRILGYIGRGGMGIVLKAYEESLDRTVALKILRPELAGDGVALGRFTREAKAAAALRHPNIVTIHAVGEHHGVHFLAMEYVEGPSLAEVIRCSYQPSAVSPSGPRPRVADSPIPNRQPSIRNPETVRHIFRQLLEALAAAHDAGLIHRDVKSSNILLDLRSSGGSRDQGIEGSREDHCTMSPSSLRGSVAEPALSAAEGSLPLVKLADFGLARMITAQTRVTLGDSILGTPEYMSPEQARGDESIDHRSDLYSAGVVLYEMLTGRTPFRADTPSAVIHQILNTDAPEPRMFNQDVDPALASLSLRLMAKEPDDRLPSAQEAIGLLEAGNPVGSLEARRRLRRRILAGTFGLPLVAGAAWLMLRLASGRHIVKAWAGEPDTTVIWAKYADGSEEVFHEFPAEVDRIRAVAVLDLDGAGDQVVVAGLNRPLGGHNLVAFDARGNEIWGLDVSNVALGYHWPDCTPSGEWTCYFLEVGNLDGLPGDELVVVAKNPDDYPARIAVVDPRTHKIRSTFWHMGQLETLRVFDGFLGPGRPAIVAWGCNNKLDGFGDPPPRPYTEALPGEDAPGTKYDIVTVLVVLDPADMNGLGPPRTNAQRLNIPAARPFAYAFLDMPATVGTTFVRGGQKVHPDPHDVGYIESFTLRGKGGAAGPAQLQVSVGYAHSASGVSTVQLSVGPDLRLLDASPVSGSTDQKPEDEWHRLWRPIVQNGKYLDE